MSTPVKALIVYTSQPASLEMATFLSAAAQGQYLVIRPVAALPAPDPQRRQQLRTERLELRNDINAAEFGLEQYRSGAWQPDAGHENGLRFDLEALGNRLRGVETVLGLGKGGVDNG